MKRDHMCLSGMVGAPPVGAPSDRLWKCGDCKQVGTMEELRARDCPKGQAPVLRDLPQKIHLVTEERRDYLAHASIVRDDDYDDPVFVKLLKLPKRSLDILRRLGALDRVWWTAHSKIDEGYIGTIEQADWLVGMGIAPQKADPSSNVCSIGFCEREQAWYGWSHRARYGFQIGYVAEEDHLVTQTGYIESYIKEHPEADRSVPVGFECKTLDDCKRCAIAFADSVG